MRTWLALLCLLRVAASVHADEWVRVETPSFIVFGQDEKRARQVTAEFERFREAIGHVLPAVVVAPAVPTTVVVFESQRAFAPFRPRYNGKAVRLGGFFFGTQNENTIALSADDGVAAGEVNVSAASVSAARIEPRSCSARRCPSRSSG